MTKRQIKYESCEVCFQEIPDEINLTLFITNCPYNCSGCHSPWLHADCGTIVETQLQDILKAYSPFVSCVLFMGGDDAAQIDDLIKQVKAVKQTGLKVALYSGADKMPEERLLNLLDYVKIGSYKSELGGLKSPTTNQKLYKRTYNQFVDITERFWEKQC